MPHRVVVIGAGAAGTMAAIFAARAGAATTLVERTKDGGRKILISGGGRCNVLRGVRRPWDEGSLDPNDHPLRSSASRPNIRSPVPTYRNCSMLTSEDQRLLERYMPLIEAELHRIGVSEADQRWIHAGAGDGDQPLEQVLLEEIAALRRLPTGMGVVQYCAYLGFDYETVKGELFATDHGDRG